MYWATGQTGPLFPNAAMSEKGKVRMQGEGLGRKGPPARFSPGASNTNTNTNIL